MNQTDNPEIHEVLAWRRDYEDRLRQDWGWLTVTGLHWIEEGVHRVGSAASAEIPFEAGPAVPEHAASIIREGNEVRLEVVEPGSVLRAGEPALSGPLHFDGTQGERFGIGNQSFLVVRRGDRVGVRTWNNDSVQRRDYSGSDWFPADPAMRVTATFSEFPEPRTIHWLNVIGDEKQSEVAGEWRFSLHGRDLALVSLYNSGADPFFVLRDGTSGTETYGASRFLKGTGTDGNTTVLDFNRAFNPPCAFTPHATCPLPPRENVLDVRIEAGERLYSWNPPADQ